MVPFDQPPQIGQLLLEHTGAFQVIGCFIGAKGQDMFEIGSLQKPAQHAFAEKCLVIVQCACCPQQAADVVLARVNVGHLLLDAQQTVDTGAGRAHGA